MLFNFPPNAGATGTAAYLAVFASLLNTMRALREAGYRVDVPPTVEALRDRILGGNAARFGTDANVVARIPADEHVRRETFLPEIERQWGPAPGRVQADGASLFVLGAEFGNLFVGVQPAFGYEGDPMRLAVRARLRPDPCLQRVLSLDTGGFRRSRRAAFRHAWRAGVHARQAGRHVRRVLARAADRRSPELLPVRVEQPVRRHDRQAAGRRGADQLSHPAGRPCRPVSRAWPTSRRRSIAGVRCRRTPRPPQRDALAALVQAQAATVELAPAEPAWADTTGAIATLGAALLELEYTLIPHGLHVVGEPPGPDQRAELLDAAGITDPVRRAELDALLATDHELPAIIHALDGGYLRPAPGGDLLRTTDVLPTGRNLHGFDPFRLPSAFAVQDGARQAERLLARHAAEGGGLPETVAMVLWGTDNLKTEGGPIAQALWLIGAEPRFDSYGRLTGAQLLPLATLGRPRVDVVITLSGIFRDLLPLQTKLLAEAALLAASADEPAEQNFVRKHALAFQAAHGGDMEQAALRIFGNADGAYGANVNQLVGNGGWNDEDELADAYHAPQGLRLWGERPAAAARARCLATCWRASTWRIRTSTSIELGVTTIDHYFDTLGGISRAVRSARGGTAAAVYIGDQTRGDGTVRTISEQVALETRTRALNPKWYEGLLKHGYEGVREIEAHVTNTLGWSATTGQVAPWIYQQIAETYVLDDAMRHRLADLNPVASAKIANRLIEAHERTYWTPDPATLDALRRAGDELEDRLEGIEVEIAA